MPLLDSHVLELSFRSLHTLLRRHPDNAAIHGMVYAINLTADTLLADDFVRRVETLLARLRQARHGATATHRGRWRWVRAPKPQRVQR